MKIRFVAEVLIDHAQRQAWRTVAPIEKKLYSLPVNRLIIDLSATFLRQKKAATTYKAAAFDDQFNT